MKIDKKNDRYTAFGGIYFVETAYNNSGLRKLIDNELSYRNSRSKYSYSDIIKFIFEIFLCGGDCAEDIQSHLREAFEYFPSNKVPSADTLLRGMKELATNNTTVVSTSGKSYNFNINEKLNNLLLKSLLCTKQLKSGEYYDFDYDNQIIEHNKHDAKRTYKQNTGYFPGIATLGDKIVYIENRDGNSNVKLDQSKTLERAYKLMVDNKIFIHRSRMDAGSYSKDIIEVVEKYSRLFYIRANKNQGLTERVKEIDTWHVEEINFKTYELASLTFNNLLEDKELRLVVMREKNTDGQLDLFTGDDFIYRSILTNDHQSSEKEIIEYYNQRASEKIFDIQNNDFGWNHLPFSDMNHNTVYLIITAMLKNFYTWLIDRVAQIFQDIKPTSRLKQFIFRFITVCGKWVRKSRQWVLNIYTKKPYEKLNLT